MPTASASALALAPNIYTIKVETNLNGNYWIRVRRNNQYIPYKTPKPLQSNDTWTTIPLKKEKPIYYWVVESHNFFDRRDKSFHLYFVDPDLSEIEIMDQSNHMAIDNNKQLRSMYVQLKHNGMKLNPTFFIARSFKQIEDALKHVKYCVVKIDNNEQRLVEDVQELKFCK